MLVGFEKNVLVALGILAIAEAVLAMRWKSNDRTLKAQVARSLRIVGGIILIFIGLRT